MQQGRMEALAPLIALVHAAVEHVSIALSIALSISLVSA